MNDPMFDSLSKAIKGLAQKCNRCGRIEKMKNTNVCKNCSKAFKKREVN